MFKEMECKMSVVETWKYYAPIFRANNYQSLEATSCRYKCFIGKNSANRVHYHHGKK